MGLTCSVFVKISNRAKQTAVHRNCNFEILYYSEVELTEVQRYDFVF